MRRLYSASQVCLAGEFSNPNPARRPVCCHDTISRQRAFPSSSTSGWYLNVRGGGLSLTPRIERPLCVRSLSSTFSPSWPMSYFRARPGSLSERHQSAVGLSCNGPVACPVFPFLLLISIWHVVTRRVARTWVTVRPQRGPYTGRGKRAHGAMNKERHVCARRRVGEAAGPDGLVSDRTRSYHFYFSSLSRPVSYFRTRVGRLSQRNQSAVGIPLLRSCNGCRRQWRRMFEATPSRSAGVASFRRKVEAKLRAVNGALWLQAEKASQPWPILFTPATLPRSTPSPKTSTRTASW